MSTRTPTAGARGTARPQLPRYDGKPAVTTLVYSGPAGPAPQPAVEVSHDRKRHRLRVTGRDGKTAEFDDRAVRFLVIAPDPRTKSLRPVLVRGEPLYYCLCPEVPPAPGSDPTLPESISSSLRRSS